MTDICMFLMVWTDGFVLLNSTPPNPAKKRIDTGKEESIVPASFKRGNLAKPRLPQPT